jgi:capsular polysaccharide biosynthesis protein
VRRTLEALFRHTFQVLLLVIFFPLIGVACTYFFVPKTYQASSSLWALRRYAVIGATGSESDLTSTPSETQATALTDLLQTRSFTLDVAQGIDLAPTLGLSASVVNDPQQFQQALFTEISTHVVVTAAGYNLFKITYINRNPQIAQQVVQAVIREYGSQSQGLSVAEGKELLVSYQAQLQSATQAENQAVNAEAHYLAQHPGLASSPAAQAADPQYQQLEAARSQAEANVENIQNTIETIQQSISTTGGNSDTLFQTIDSPHVTPVSRTKDYLVGGGVGLGVALLTVLIFLVILVRRDRAIYSTGDVQEVVNLPVIMQLPHLTAASLASLVDDTLAG